MKCNFIKVLLAFILTGVVVGLSLSGKTMPNLLTENTISSPLAFLFQIMFILFFISPPIIALMLFLIWKELKERNRMK